MTLASARPHLTVVPPPTPVPSVVANETPDTGHLDSEFRRDLRTVVASIRERYGILPRDLWVRFSLHTSPELADAMAKMEDVESRPLGEHSTMALLAEEVPDDLHPERTEFEVVLFGDDRWPRKPLRIGKH